MQFSIDKFRLDGKVALVTGAGARGNSIGRAYAQGLAGVGARVVVADLDTRGAETVAAEIAEHGAEVLALNVDIADPESVKRMAAAAKDVFGGIDIS